MGILILVAICVGLVFIIQTMKSGQDQQTQRHQVDVALRAKESIERDFPNECAVVPLIIQAESSGSPQLKHERLKQMINKLENGTTMMCTEYSSAFREVIVAAAEEDGIKGENMERFHALLKTYEIRMDRLLYERSCGITGRLHEGEIVSGNWFVRG